jgi:toxin CcdB
MSTRQFDVFANSDSESADSHPYFIILQSDALSHIDTVIVAPLVPPKKIKLFERLLPEVVVNGSRYVIATPDLGAISTRLVPAPVANLESYRDQISAAIDLVFLGI